MTYFEFVFKHQKKGITFQTVSKSKSTGKMISLLDFLRKMNNLNWCMEYQLILCFIHGIFFNTHNV